MKSLHFGVMKPFTVCSAQGWKLAQFFFSKELFLKIVKFLDIKLSR